MVGGYLSFAGRSWRTERLLGKAEDRSSGWSSTRAKLGQRSIFRRQSSRGLRHAALRQLCNLSRLDGVAKAGERTLPVFPAGAVGGSFPAPSCEPLLVLSRSPTPIRPVP